MVKKIKKEKVQKITSQKKKRVLSKNYSKKILVKSKKRILKTNKTKDTQIKKRVVLRKKKIIKKEEGIKLQRAIQNPIIKPTFYPWESEAVFNPAAVASGGLIHLFYRALGSDGISRIGYASSHDGINFENRLSYPVYIAQNFEEAQKHWPFTSPARLSYNPILYTSGGGWGGCEDPRTVIIDGDVYMTFNMFNGWNSMRVAVVSIREEDLKNKKWNWKNFSYLSRPGDRQKNWVLFPEKINGKFALFCNLDKGDPNKVYIAYLNQLNMIEAPSQNDAPDPQLLPDHEVAWHYRTRSAAAPPIKTKDGWLLLYHAMDKNEPNRYKVGVMLLDLKNPEKVLYRAQHPILEPDEWYENDYKPGIVYANGAVVKNGELFVYYGGGDKHVAVASIALDELLDDLKSNRDVKLKKKNK
ncbi:MAG: hypothetical protein WC603_01705 [Candidatus Paceibacterota bacterium]|jgi:predicted GH43/DUF377 family glycosyl hydrolase